jgi:hypothetical protein
MILPAPAQAVVDAFLEAAEVEVPTLVEGLYLVGSVALDDFRPQRSDVDFVAVTATRPDALSLAGLGRIHARLRASWRRPFFDGIYVTWDDLASDPTRLGPGPSVHESRFQSSSRGERNPITWHTLVQQGIRCHGPAIAALPVWNDPLVLATWTDNNLDSYWRRLVERGARLTTRYGLIGLTAWACEWCVLGSSRLHYTLASGAITSKEGAGRYALATFPVRWHRLIEEALRIRCAAGGRSAYRSPLTRRRELLAFTGMVIADAHRLYARPGT